MFRIQLLSPAREWITTGPAFPLFEDAQEGGLLIEPCQFCRLAVEITSDLCSDDLLGESLLPGIYPITRQRQIEDLEHVSFLGRFAGPDDYSSYTEEFPEWLTTEIAIRDLELAFPR